MKLTFEMLSEAAYFAHEEYVAGAWTNEIVHKWCKTFCIKESSAKLILLHADKCKEYHDAMADPDSSQALKDALTREKERVPHLYAPWPQPAV